MKHLMFAAALLLPLAAPAPALAGQGATGGPAISTWQNVSDAQKGEDPYGEVAAWAFDQLDLSDAELGDFADVAEQMFQGGWKYRMDLITMDGDRWRVEVHRSADGAMELTSAQQVQASGE